MDELFAVFAVAQKNQDGYLLASTLCVEPPASTPDRLQQFRQSTNTHNLSTDLRYKLQYNPDIRFSKPEASLWIEVFTNYYGFVDKFLTCQEQHAIRPASADWNGVYDAWKAVVNSMSKGYQGDVLRAWTIPCLYTAAKYLRVLAIKADNKVVAHHSNVMFDDAQTDDVATGNEGREHLEDAARQINRLFSMCINDRNALDDSRKWAVYYIVNLLFKTYFKLSSISLCKNLIRSVGAAGSEMPPLEAYPRAHQVTFNYYCGVLRFLDEDYVAAEKHLTIAFEKCSASATRNAELILTYLIPTKLLTSQQLPTIEFLQRYPNVNGWFAPIRSAVRGGNLAAFTAALEISEDEFVKRRIYLTLERGRDIIIRNLFRRVFITGGFEPAKGSENDSAIAPLRRTRIPINEFAAALQLAGAEVCDDGGNVDTDEVECLIANSIYKGFMKGYIARDRGMVVLSKAGAFPGTGV